MTLRTLVMLAACSVAAFSVSPLAQTAGVPVARLVTAPTYAVPGRVDSAVPLTWTRIDDELTLVGFASWGGIPARMAGPDLERLAPAGAPVIDPHPGHGIWFESVIADETDTTWYAYYHHELPAFVCDRPDRQIPRIGAAASTDRGMTWKNLGIILDAPPGSAACGSTNRYVIGGVGDVSAMLDRERKDIYFYFSSYARDREMQGVMLARLAWADRDEPRGRITIWNDGAWLSATRVVRETNEEPDEWEYPAGTPLVRPTSPWHDGNSAANAFWGPSIHWNTSLERYVMLLNRTRNEDFGNEGIYVSYAEKLDDPGAWSAPTKIMNEGGWYPQVAGSELGEGTDKQMGRRARFFLTGRSTRFIEFGTQ